MAAIRLPLGTIFAISNIQATPLLPTKFQVNWPFGSGEKVKKRFSRCRPWRPSWISGRNDFSFFLIYKFAPMLPTKFQVHWPFDSGAEGKKKKEKIDSQDSGHGGHLGFPIGTSYFWSTSRIGRRLGCAKRQLENSSWILGTVRRKLSQLNGKFTIVCE